MTSTAVDRVTSSANADQPIPVVRGWLIVHLELVEWSRKLDALCLGRFAAFPEESQGVGTAHEEYRGGADNAKQRPASLPNPSADHSETAATK